MNMTKFEKWFINSQKHAVEAINRADKLLSFINIKEDQKFLEVGCGNGAVSKHVARKYPLIVTGVDVDLEQIQLAQQNIDDIPNIQFLTIDATNLLFQDDYFDIVLSFGVMHHISNWLDSLKEIRRILKPRGYFIYFDIIFPNWLARIGKLFKHSYGITTIHD